jgi:ATP-dependent 26S proteasome regulatory subunit
MKSNYYKKVGTEKSRNILSQKDMDDSQNIRIVDDGSLYLDDIVGQEKAITELKQFVLSVSNKEIFKQWGLQPPKGLLFVGGPGTGKTATVKALKKSSAGRIEVMELRFSDVANRYINATLESIKDFIETAKEVAKDKYVVIFIDEIDSMIPSRNNIQQEQTSERINAFLAWMDGGNSELTNITLIGATNNIDLLDPAILRPGRFDKIIHFENLDAEALTKCMRVHLTKKNLNKNQIGIIDWEEVNYCFSGRLNSGAIIPEILNLILRKKACEHLRLLENKMHNRKTTSHIRRVECWPTKINTENIVDGINEFFMARDGIGKNSNLKKVVGF